MKKKNIPSYIKNFCTEIFKETPKFVPIKAIPNAPLNDCFPVVTSLVKEKGGKQIFGWCIHVWRKVLIEAEFHCVWETPEGKLIDVTPKIESGTHIVFITDPDQKYEGRQVNNIRKSLTMDPDAKKFIKLFDEYFILTNEGDLADKHGVIPIESKELRLLTEELVSVELRLKSKYGNQRILY